MLKNKDNKVFLIILMLMFLVYAENVNIRIKGNNTPGPYPLGKSFIDSTSIDVAYEDSSKANIPSFIYIGEKNGILFSQAIDSTTVLNVEYETRFSGISKNYSLFKKRYMTEEEIQDTSVTLRNIEKSRGLNELSVSGFKSIGVSAGNNGQMDLTQALEVKIFGKLNDKTTLSANLSDQGTSLEGDTREIGEIDLLYIKMENPLFNIVVGDMYKTSIEEGIFTTNKKIKGLSAAFTGNRFGIGAYGALSGGKFAVEVFHGSLGKQGPYELSGNGEDDIINPVGGTVKVFLNGKEINEKDEFIVDYDLGSITFTEKNLINNNSTIKVEYEYKSFDYQRVFAGTDIYTNLFDNKLKVKGFFWHETDNKDYPIELDLDTGTINTLKGVGDALPLVPPINNDIDKNDVPRKSALFRLYKKEPIVGSNEDTMYVYHEYNPLIPEDNEGYYHVWFHETEFGMGDYVDSSFFDQNYQNSDFRGDVYTYVGAGLGNYTILTEVPAPKRNLMGEIIAEFKPRDNILIKIDAAGESFDKNTFSSIDDNDNSSSALLSNFQIGKKDNYERTFWIAGEQNYSSMNFSRNILSNYKIQKDWDILNLSNSAINIWEAKSGVTIIPGVALNAGYGQLLENKDIMSHRSSYGLFLGKENTLEMNYKGELLTHDQSEINDKLVLKDSVKISAYFPIVNISVLGNDEWRSGDSVEGHGHLGAGLDLGFSKVGLKESFYFSQSRKGGSSIFNPTVESSRDTGYTVIWEQNFRKAIRKGWNLSMGSSYQKELTKNINGSSEEASVLLINAENKIISQKIDASAFQNYRLSSENSSSYELVPGPFLGVGKGTYKKDTLTNEWVIDNNLGTHDITIVEVFDSTRSRKSNLNGSWHFNPDRKKTKGIGRDLKWRGSFSIEEHIYDEKLRDFYSWIPGVTTIHGDMDDAVSFSNMHYKQDIIWNPEFVKNFTITVTAKPYTGISRISRDGGFEGSVKTNKRWTKFTLENNVLGHLLNREHKSVENEVNIKDVSLDLLQRYYFIPELSIFAKENAGLSERLAITEKDTISGPYFRLQPGLTLRLPKKGMAELSYTFSYVDIGKSSDQIEYPMAQGFYNGKAHSIQFFIDIRAGKHININGSYRGDYGDNTPDKDWLHLLSLEMKILL